MSIRWASALVAAVALTAPLGAQSDPRLLGAVRQAQEGQGDSARAAVRRLFAATASTDSLYPQILYAMAVVAPDAAERERSLQRLVVEYPISSWTDDALLLMAESDYADGNLPATTRDLERIRKDFVGSPVIPRAALWAARTYFDMRNQVAACRWITLGIVRSGENGELHDQLSVQARRCGALIASSDTLVQRDTQVTVQVPPVAPAPVPVEVSTTAPAMPSPAAAADSGRPPANGGEAAPLVARMDTVRVAPAPAPARAGGFRVQLAAAATQAEADGIVRSLRGQHIDADVVPEKGYFKVRTGHFASRRDAQALATQLRARLGGGPFVVGE